MKRIILSIVGVLLLVTILFFGYLAFNAETIVAKFKPELERIASKSIGAEVKLGQLSVSVFPRVKVRVADFSLAEVNSSEQMVFKDLYLSLNPFKLLTGKISVSTLEVNEPVITLVKDGDKIRIAGLPEKKKDTSASKGQRGGGSKSETSEPTELPVGLNIDSIKVHSAKLNLHDQASAQTFDLATLDIDSGISTDDGAISVHGLDIDGSILGSGEISIAGGISKLQREDSTLAIKGDVSKLPIENGLSIAALFAPGLSITGQGPVTLSLIAEGAVTSPTASGSINLGGTRIEKSGVFSKDAGQDLTVKVNASPTRWPNLDLAANINGTAINLSALSSPVNGLESVVIVKGTADDPSITVQNLNFTLGGESITATLSANKADDVIRVSPITIDAFSGQSTAAAELNNATKRLATDLHMKDLDLKRVMTAFVPAQKDVFEGKLNSLDVSLQGTLGEAILQSLNGQGSLRLSDGKMIGSNLGGEVLKTVGNLPFLSGTLFSMIPEEKREKFLAKDTELKSVSGDFTLENGRIVTRNLTVKSSSFDLFAAGAVSFDTTVDLKCKMSFDPELSANIVQKVKELRGSLDPEGRLIVPLQLTGKAPIFVITPDISELVKSSLKGAASQAIEGLLKDGKLGGKKGLGGLLGF